MINLGTFFSMEYILPKKTRLGEVPRTKDAYAKYMGVAWPAVLQGLLIQIATVIDLAMVGSLGANAIAAIGVMGQPCMVLLILVRAISVPVVAMIARRFGEGDICGMNSILKQGILLTMLLYFPLILTSLNFMPEIVTFAGAQPETVQIAADYGFYVAIGLFFSAFSQVVGAALIGIGNTKIIFLVNLVGNMVNTIMNIFLIFGIWIFPRLEVTGAGIATMIGHMTTACLMLYVAVQGKKSLCLRGPETWTFTKDFLHNMKHLGGSSLGEQSFERFGMFAYTKMVASLGVVPLAAHYVCMQLCDIFYLVANGLSQASASYTGQNLGAKRPDMATAYGKIGVRIGFVAALIAFVLYVAFETQLMHIFTTDEAVVELGKEIIILVALSSFPSALQMVYAGVLRGAGDSYYVMLYSLGSIAVFRPIITYLFCFTFGWGIKGAWIALICDQSVRMLFSGYRFLSGKWRHVKI